MDSIESLRKQIDALNFEILELLTKRAQLVKSIGIEKRNQGLKSYDPVREYQQIKSIISKNSGLFSDDSLTKIFLEIFAASKQVQNNSLSDLIVSKSIRKESPRIELGKGIAIFSGCEPMVFAGPCSIENHSQMEAVCAFLSGLGIKCLRAGAFKPRTSPYTFQGLGEEGLKILKDCGERFGMILVSEAVSEATFATVADYCDVIQIGSRNMFNYELLKMAGSQSKPILLKRHFSATIEEFIYSAEYIAGSGNENVILCERGIRTFEPSTRNTLDLSAVPLLKMQTCLPVIVDLSHSTGRKDIISSMAKASLAAGADGVMVEVHPEPRTALSDSNQQLDFSEFESFLKKCFQTF